MPCWICNLFISHAVIFFISNSDWWSGVFIDSQWITVVQDTLLWCGLSVLWTFRCSETWSAAWCATNYFLQIISYCAWATLPSSSGIRKKKQIHLVSILRHVLLSVPCLTDLLLGDSNSSFRASVSLKDYSCVIYGDSFMLVQSPLKQTNGIMLTC